MSSTAVATDAKTSWLPLIVVDFTHIQSQR